MHNRKVFPFKDLNYAASKSSLTLNSATNPSDLRDGAIGIYGIHRGAGVNLNKMALITDGGSEIAGAVPMASFVGEDIVIAFGVATGPSQLSNPINKPYGLKKAVGEKYVAPVMGVYRIGYNATAGSDLNTPNTIVGGEDFTISIADRNYIVSGQRDPFNKVNISVAASPGDTDYSLAKRWVAAAQAKTNPIFVDKTKMKILHNGAGAAFTTSATVAAVNGATTLTTSAAHGVTAGDTVSLDGDLYGTLAGTAGTTLVLDRPYTGATGTIANANTLDISTPATAYGIELTDDQAGRNLSFATDGLITDATRKVQTAAFVGNGGQSQVQELEKEALPKKGTHDQIQKYAKIDIIRASGNYDMYWLTIQNANHPTGQQGSVFNVINYIVCAFPTAIADTAGFAQSDFEDIMTSLFGSTFPAISA